MGSHVGVRGNEEADEMAKEALGKGAVEMNVGMSKAEVKSVIWERVNQMWQERWDNEVEGRHLYRIQESVRVRRVGSGQRKEESVLVRLRLGHSALNKWLKLIGKHQTGLCEGCQEEESVEHVVMTCRRYGAERERLRDGLRELGLRDFTLEGLLGMEDGHGVRVLLQYLRVTGLVDRI